MTIPRFLIVFGKWSGIIGIAYIILAIVLLLSRRWISYQPAEKGLLIKLHKKLTFIGICFALFHGIIMFLGKVLTGKYYFIFGPLALIFFLLALWFGKRFQNHDQVKTKVRYKKIHIIMAIMGLLFAIFHLLELNYKKEIKNYINYTR